ncbi:MAG: transposase [Candidatus Omnitrophota bacterium]
MPRSNRLYIDHACYHIITRGNQKQIIFLDDQDFEKYLHIVRKAKRKYLISIYAYCLMHNHVHLLIEPSNAKNISNFMHWVSRGFTAYFNMKYNKVGHLWQGRFISKPILKGLYLLQCAEYIENNPLRSGVANNLMYYEWSSYKERNMTDKTSLLDPWGQVQS